MTAPTAPIDADLGEWDKISYFVLEADAIWRTQDLGGGSATWTQVYDPATLFEGGTFEAFDRIRCAPGTPSPVVYALGHGVKEDTGDHQPFVLRSENNGLTWSQHWIDDVVAVREYTVTHCPVQKKTIDGGGAAYFDFVIDRPDDDNTYSPYAMATRLTPQVIGDGWDEMTGDGTTVQSGGETTNMWDLRGMGNALDGDVNTAGQGFLDDFFGAGNWTGTATAHDMVKDAGRTHIKFGIASHGTPSNTCQAEAWVFWNIPELLTPKALDVARGNPNCLYVGLRDKIICSTNGGFDWTDYVTASGAYDICVDPQLGGVIYYWSTAGQLQCAIAGVVQTALLTGETGGEFANPFRIARDFNSGKLWAVHNTELKLRDLASWSVQKTGLAGACGLRPFYASPTKLALLDSTDIYLSLDAGATWAAKKGGWAAYAAPRTIHLLEAP